MTSVPLPRALRGACVLALGLLAGCSSEKPSGLVSGAVSYKGAAVSSGNVNFQLKGAAASGGVAKIEAGRYKLDAPLPVGTYEVYLTETFPDPKRGVDTKPVPIGVPRKFLNATTSGLTFEVKAGPNDLPIELKE